MVWAVDPADIVVGIYQLFGFWSTKYLSETVEGCSLIPTTLSSSFTIFNNNKNKTNNI